MPNRVHPLMHAMQALLLEPLGDRPPPKPHRHQLPASDHAMLALGELRNRLVVPATHPPNRFFCTYGMHFCRFVAHRPIVAASV